MLEIQPKQPSAKGPAEMFTGDVWFDVIAKGQEPSRMRVNMVRFVPCPYGVGILTPSARRCTSPRAVA